MGNIPRWVVETKPELKKKDGKITYGGFKEDFTESRTFYWLVSVCSATAASPLMLNYPDLTAYSLYSCSINGNQHVVSRETVGSDVSASSLL